MAVLKLNGNEISTNNAGCPVEIVPADTSCASANFFKTNSSDQVGKVAIPGITDKGNKLISADSSTNLSDMVLQDAFEGKLKIKGEIQKYCRKGLAPRGVILAEYSGGSYRIVRKSNGQCDLIDSSGNVLLTLSTPNENRQVFTFMICGGGGGGAGGKSSFGYYGSGGGGGGGRGTFGYTVGAVAGGDGLFRIYY